MNYDTILKNYLHGLWTADMVRLAAKKGVITTKQCDEILAQKS